MPAVSERELTPQLLLEKLGSGEYKQAYEMLSGLWRLAPQDEEGDVIEEIIGYCCLGVACQLTGKRFAYEGETDIGPLHDDSEDDDVIAWDSDHWFFTPVTFFRQSDRNQDKFKNVLIWANDYRTQEIDTEAVPDFYLTIKVLEDFIAGERTFSQAKYIEAWRQKAAGAD